MKKDLNDLYDERGKIVKEQREINDLADKEDRDFSAEEQERYDKMDTRYDELDTEIKAGEAKEERVKNLAKREDAARAAAGKPVKNSPGEERKDPREELELRRKGLPEKYHNLITAGVRGSVEYMEAYRRHLVLGDMIIQEDRSVLEASRAYRALQADIDTSGGYMVAPEQFVAQLIQEKDNLLWFRQFARIFPLANAASVGYPRVANNPSDSDWTAELLIGGTDTTMSLEKRSLTPHPLAKLLKVSKKLIRVSAIPVDALVRERLAYSFAVTEEKAFMTGQGSNKPLGIFVASNAGITTSRDKSTGNTTTAIKADGLIEAKYALLAQYRRNCRWIFHRDAIKMVSKLKDGEGNYLWQPGLQQGQPDRILGFPVSESEYCPSTFTTGKYVGMLCDLSQYWIAEALNMQLQVVTELYAATNENGYIGRAELDGMPVDELAYVRITLA